MARQFFGTDGIRGTANQWPMTAEIALQVGMAAGRQFIRGSHKHRVVIGKDTRRSGYMLEPALAAGFTAVGMDVIMTGPIPTPAIAMLTRSLRADLGVMISASHNPYQDNGIKLFGPDGYKLSDEIEEAIEADILEGLAADHTQPDPRLAEAAELGAARQMEDARGRYIEFAKNTFAKGLRLDGLKVVIDCANGAAYKVAPTVLWELGADIIEIGVSPNGYNINKDCGSTATDAMCAKVQEVGADIGIALDGDADRVLIADENGDLVDGDQLMAVIAQAWSEAGILAGGGLVATVMSNLGLEKFMEGRGLNLIRTQVGDRYVVEEMRAGGYNVGGEQSGHIVLSDFGTTGDGLVAALQILTVVAGTRLKNPSARVSEICAKFDPYPQLLKNVRYETGDPLSAEAVKAAIDDGENRLGSDGRLVIRKSGTEPLIRVMAEGSDDGLVEQVVDDICQAVKDAS